MTRGVGGASSSNVQEHLKGADDPATKDDVIQAPKRNDAPRDVMGVVENLPRDRFGGPQDVRETYGESH